MPHLQSRSPKKRAPRPTSGVERGTGCQLGGDVISHSENHLAAQFLALQYGLPIRRAALIAALAFEVRS